MDTLLLRGWRNLRNETAALLDVVKYLASRWQSQHWQRIFLRHSDDASDDRQVATPQVDSDCKSPCVCVWQALVSLEVIGPPLRLRQYLMAVLRAVSDAVVDLKSSVEACTYANIKIRRFGRRTWASTWRANWETSSKKELEPDCLDSPAD